MVHHKFYAISSVIAGSAAILYSLYRIWRLEERLAMMEVNQPKNRPKWIILVRHGESEGNVNHAIYKTIADNEIRLTEKGESQALEAGDKLKQLIGDRKVFCYVSPYMRTRQTASLILSRLLPEQVVQKREDPRIREQEFAGSFQDENPSTEERAQYSRFFFRFKGGESGADVFDRVSLFLDTLYRDFRLTHFDNDSVVLIVSHGLTMRLFLMRWLHWSVEIFNKTVNPDNCTFAILERQPADRHGKSYYRLTPESLDALQLTREFAESKPSAWPRPERQSQQLQQQSSCTPALGTPTTTTTASSTSTTAIKSP